MRRIRTAQIAVPIALLASAATAGADDTASDDAAAEAGDPIVVSGIAQQEERLEDFATQLSEADPTSPIALYEPGQYCPGVVGLSPVWNQEIARRMREVAQATGIKPAQGACRTSALVLFGNNRRELLRQFQAMHPEYFTELTGERIDFQGREAPVMAWKLLARLDRDGKPIQVNGDGIQVVEVNSGMSRTAAATRPIIAMSVVLIDRSAIRGLNTRQIADYALMRSVTDTDPARVKASVAPTILKVVDAPEGSETPLSLTSWDFAYVKSRYAVNRWSLGPSQMASIRAGMKHNLQAGE
ncbi:hypothetical protein GRI40_12660 [Altererythrobacter aerius]|uniref:Uncharacterized protein n=1 Tax=Tsuneonella aeria TaxID=1837929 RepID=A0A6I4THJ6_9SPHN|nr:hypothetical protein [Tsuneonella aeria]MXO76067.1 hypothetical protein [Tsuneonella aeria]